MCGSHCIELKSPIPNYASDLCFCLGKVIELPFFIRGCFKDMFLYCFYTTEVSYVRLSLLTQIGS